MFELNQRNDLLQLLLWNWFLESLEKYSNKQHMVINYPLVSPIGVLVRES